MFDTAVSSIPVCTPWRAALLTGQYPLTNGVFLNDVRLPTDRPTLGTILRDAGYDTAYIGKWHLDGDRRGAFTPPGPRRQGFEFWAAANCTHDYLRSFYYRDTPERLWWDGYDAVAQTDMAVDYIASRPADRPFALVLSWGPPHNPYRDVPREYLDRYPVPDVEVPANCPDPVREDLAGYCAHVTALDEQLARIVAAIDAAGLRDDTILVYTSDHGDMLGSQGMTRKQHPWDESIRVPFLLRCPDQAGHGRHLSFPDSAWPDILPTLLGLAGVAIPGWTPSRGSRPDVSPAIRGERGDRSRSRSTPSPCASPRSRNTSGQAPWRGVRSMRALQLCALAGRPGHPVRHRGRSRPARQPLRQPRMRRPAAAPGGRHAAAPRRARR